MSKPVPVTPEQLEEMGVERDFTIERTHRVLPFIKKFFTNLGEHAFVFATGGKGDIAQIDAVIASLEERAPTDPELTEEQKAEIDGHIATLKEKREAIVADTDGEVKSFNDFYEQKFIAPALEQNLLLRDLRYTFGLANTAVEMLKSIATTPDVGQEYRLVPCALEVYKALGDQPDLMLGVTSDEDPARGAQRSALYEKMYKEVIVPIFDKHEVKYNEVLQVFGILSAIIAEVKHKVDVTISGARVIAEAKLWGIPDIDDLSIMDVHKKCIEKTEE